MEKALDDRARGDLAALEYFLTAMGCSHPAALAEELIQRFGSLRGVFTATEHELSGVRGMTERVAAFLFLSNRFTAVRYCSRFLRASAT